MRRNSLTLISLVVALLATAGSVMAQSVVSLTKLVIEPKHTEYVSTRNSGTPNIIDVKSSNPSVATAEVYRVSRVQIVGVAEGRTDVEFFDSAQRILYKVPVWVEKANATGGGGAGYDPKKRQLAQVVMLVKHTQNVTVPGAGAHQLSSVVSSNPSVATARTNTANTIQIYSVALGDTFIDFTDNATGTTYQVHVWVVQKLGDPIGGGGGFPPGSKPMPPNPKGDPIIPKPPDFKPKHVNGAPAGAMDACLVGTWRSQTVTNNFIHWDNGGGGVVMKIKGDGGVDMDYSGMQPNHSEGKTVTWRGSASGHITAKDGTLSVASVESSNITTNYTFSNGAPPFNGTLEGLGNLLQSAFPYSYDCNGTTLTLKSHAFTTVFTKLEN